MDLLIEPSASVFESSDLMITSFYSPIKLDIFDEESDLGDDEPINIGYIMAERLNLLYNPKDMVLYADSKSEDLCVLAAFFFLETDIHHDFLGNYLFYIDKVFIEPKYRGFNHGLKALVLFLELFAQGQVVSCHTIPTDDLSNKYPKEKGKKIMRRYWSQIGLNNYDEQHNILWEIDWEVPDWLNPHYYSPW